MLIARRRPGEALIIELPNGDTAKITVLGNQGNKVKIGCSAEQDIKIYREELYQRIKEEEAAA